MIVMMIYQKSQVKISNKRIKFVLKYFKWSLPKKSDRGTTRKRKKRPKLKNKEDIFVLAIDIELGFQMLQIKQY